MHVRCIALLLLFASVSGEPFGRGGSRGGGSHSYPSSHGYSGSSASRSSHTYPQSPGLSGSSYRVQQHTYQHQPQTSNQQHQHTTYHSHQPHNTYNYQQTTVHNHYNYNPPQRIVYGIVHLPVYHSPPPVYVYEYRDSGSRFDNLLTGLALYNLGRMQEKHIHREYTSDPGEMCKLGINHQNGDYEETRIDCKVMSSFIWEMNDASAIKEQGLSTKTMTQTVVETTNTKTSSNGSESTKVTTTVTVEDALQAKGPSIQVAAGMKCFMIRVSRANIVLLKKDVECGILQSYAQQSLHYRNSASRVMPTFIVLLMFSYSFWIF